MCSAAVSIFSDFWQNAYLKNYHINLCQIFMVGKIVTVDDQPKISFFSIRQGTLMRQPIFVGYIHTTELR